MAPPLTIRLVENSIARELLNVFEILILLDKMVIRQVTLIPVIIRVTPCVVEGIFYQILVIVPLYVR